MEYKTIHYRFGNDVMHVSYRVEKSSIPPLLHWFKVYGSESLCTCPSPEAAYAADVNRRTA